MFTRSRSAVCLLALTVVGTFIAASMATNTASQQAAAAPAAEMDISSLAMGVDPARLPLTSVQDPI